MKICFRNVLISVFAITICTSSLSAIPTMSPDPPVASDSLQSVQHADSAPSSAQQENGNRLIRAITGGSIHLNNRLRSELVQTDAARDAFAVTNRLRLGYSTQPLNGISAYAEFLDLRPISRETYNAAGLNNQPDRAAIADPRMTVMNQLYAQFQESSIDLMVRIGRQRVIHSSARFVGNVGWRQNEQTFDAATLNTSFGVENLKLEYSYIWQVNRVFGPSHPAGIFTSDSHVANLTYSELVPGSTLTAFLYSLDFENQPALSSRTVGFRVNGTVGLTDDLSLLYTGSYALQQNSGNNPMDFSADYSLTDISVVKRNIGRAGVAIEVLGSDSDVSFQTPLATLHAFQGWSDLFLSTPAGGLRDLNIYASTQLPWDLAMLAKHHWFYGDESGDYLGRELNASLSKQISENLSFLIKYADFRGSSTLPGTSKLWFQAEFTF
ncbi:hypothetical protein DYD21_01135 [Rhodohalobacter sp. SW132]|uniref:alginate export family protein n=1 Tax=Rhodohalobacter sp. SW132 TaxID=2293433 RepID=UPI000E264E1A|nr:alginate export family protein [Rhodohalobacter sp. SW132]REL38584.1 hypothetical protein DYD21_01135 [Rhodohalobacter sp. SW132]